MKLATYCKESKETLTDLANRFGISISHLSEILATESNPGRGRPRRPSPDVASRIEVETGGKVTLEELLFPHGRPAAIASDEDEEMEATPQFDERAELVAAGAR